jgi:hypothetical protein
MVVEVAKEGAVEWYPPPGSGQLRGRHVLVEWYPLPGSGQLRGRHVSPWLSAQGSSGGDTCPRGSGSHLPAQGSSEGATCPRGSGGGRSVQLRPDWCGGGVIGRRQLDRAEVARSGGGRIGQRQPNLHDGEDLITSVVVAIWRAHNSNLVLRRVDVRTLMDSRATQSRSVIR